MFIRACLSCLLTVLLAIPAANALRRWLTGVFPIFSVKEAFEAEYAQKYIALVGIIPTSMGFIPLKKPFSPCVLKICCAIPYGPDFPAIRLDCSCVFTTSSGIVSVLDIVPANPPAMKFAT